MTIHQTSPRIIAFTLLSCLVITPCGLALSGHAQGSDWQLPIHLGDSKTEILPILGDTRPCVTGFSSDTCERFPNSGINVEYVDDRVSAITIGGGEADESGIPYEPPILFGITIRDDLDQLITKLGEPNVIDDGPPFRHKWRKPPWFIEVVIGGAQDGELEGEILWITLTAAVG